MKFINLNRKWEYWILAHSTAMSFFPLLLLQAWGDLQIMSLVSILQNQKLPRVSKCCVLHVLLLLLTDKISFLVDISSLLLATLERSNADFNSGLHNYLIRPQNSQWQKNATKQKAPAQDFLSRVLYSYSPKLMAVFKVWFHFLPCFNLYITDYKEIKVFFVVCLFFFVVFFPVTNLRSLCKFHNTCELRCSFWFRFQIWNWKRSLM